MGDGLRDVALSRNPMIGANSDAREKFWTSAATIARQDVPNILQEIDAAARVVIHGDQETNAFGSTSLLPAADRPRPQN